MLKPRVLGGRRRRWRSLYAAEIVESSGLEVDVACDGGRGAGTDCSFSPAQLWSTELAHAMHWTAWRSCAAHGGRTRPRVGGWDHGHGSERQEQTGHQGGALDYFRKPFDGDELVAVIKRATETARLHVENERLTGRVATVGALWVLRPMP